MSILYSKPYLEIHFTSAVWSINTLSESQGENQSIMDAGPLLERFKEALNSQARDMGPGGQRFENPLGQVDEVVISSKRRSEFEPDMPRRQRKQFQSRPDSNDINMGVDISKEVVADVREESDDGALRNMKLMITQGWVYHDNPVFCEVFFMTTDGPQ